jgi:hypothetical protein
MGTIGSYYARTGFNMQPYLDELPEIQALAVSRLLPRSIAGSNAAPLRGHTHFAPQQPLPLNMNEPLSIRGGRRHSD